MIFVFDTINSVTLTEIYVLHKVHLFMFPQDLLNRCGLSHCVFSPHSVSAVSE